MPLLRSTHTKSAEVNRTGPHIKFSRSKGLLPACPSRSDPRSVAPQKGWEKGASWLCEIGERFIKFVLSKFEDSAQLKLGPVYGGAKEEFKLTESAILVGF